MTQRVFLYAASLLLLAACGGGGGGGSSSGGTLPVQTPTAPTDPILLKQGQYQVVKLQLTGTGTGYAQSLLITQRGYTGAFTASSKDCDSVAAFSAAQNQLTVTGTAIGSCTITVSNSFSQTATLPVSVTSSDVTIQ